MTSQIPIGSKYRNLFSSTIWKRGEIYFEEGRVFTEHVDSNRLSAGFKVEGRGDFYDVYIEADQDQPGGLYMDCTCPYGLPCKHMVASLLEGLEEQIFIEKSSEPENYEQIISHFTEEVQVYDLDKEVSSSNIIPFKKENVEEPPHIVQVLPGENKLFFLISEQFDPFSDRRNTLALIPCSQYIKKDGTPGAVKTDISPRANVRGSVEEKNIFALLSYGKYENRGTRLLTYIPDILDLQTIDIRIREGKEYVPVSLKAVKNVHMEFNPARMEYPVEFSPSITLNKKTTYPVEEIIWDQNELLGCFLTPSESTLYILQEKMSQLLLLEEILEQKYFTAEDFESLLEQKRSPRISMSLRKGLIIKKRIKPSIRFLIDEEHGRTCIQPFMIYGSSKVDFFKTAAPPMQDSADGKGRILYERNHDLERALILHTLAIEREDIYSSNPLILHENLRDFLMQRAAGVLESGSEILLEKGKRKVQKQKIEMNLTSGIDWLDIRLHTNGKSLPGHFELSESGLMEIDGHYTLLDKKELERIKTLQSRAKKTKEGMRISSRDLSTLSLLEEEIKGSEDPDIQRMHRAAEKLKKGFKEEKSAVPAQLNGRLRGYQREGFSWLAFLAEFNLGGLLADDMGLGKTIQAITLLLHLRSQDASAPFLVIAPVSTLNNWKTEILRFAPTLNPHLHIGMEREIWSSENPSVVLTSYHTLMRDAEDFHNQSWKTVVLDESQALKNSRSKTYTCVKKLKAEHFLALSGTPMENHIGELWSIMNILNPGLLGELKPFLNSYRNPIQQGNERVLKELKTRISPFMLRRKKEDVAKELPPKEEVTLYVTLSRPELKFYQQLKKQHTEAILRLKRNKATFFQISSALLQALTALRQAAISPALAGGSRVSTKLDTAVDKIIEAQGEDHKILVFSQYVRVLDMLKDKLSEKEIPYESLTGSMTPKKREKALRNFQSNPEIPVFLISLKAGGTGLNLVEADYVIILDPWWNPAVENQAIDRSHRIGQTRPVTAYRLISENTVEERVMELQKQKQHLVDELMKGSDSPLKKMDTEEILKLL